MESIQELRKSYYEAIKLMSDEQLIIDSLPEADCLNYFEIMDGLIETLNQEMEICKSSFLEETDIEYREMFKEELRLLTFKKQLCEKSVLEAKDELMLENEFTNTKNKRIIFATRSTGDSYIINDIKDNSFKEEYYQFLIEMIDELENGIKEDNTEKARAMVCDKTVKGVHEVKKFKIRLYYRILSSDLAFVILTKLKKNNNDKKDKEIIRNRNSHIMSEFKYLKEKIEDENFKAELIKQHLKIRNEVLNYLEKNKRGAKSVGK